jgi:hypothetical protein
MPDYRYAEFEVWPLKEATRTFESLLTIACARVRVASGREKCLEILARLLVARQARLLLRRVSVEMLTGCGLEHCQVRWPACLLGAACGQTHLQTSSIHLTRTLPAASLPHQVIAGESDMLGPAQKPPTYDCIQDLRHGDITLILNNRDKVGVDGACLLGSGVSCWGRRGCRYRPATHPDDDERTCAAVAHHSLWLLTTDKVSYLLPSCFLVAGVVLVEGAAAAGGGAAEQGAGPGGRAGERGGRLRSRPYAGALCVPCGRAMRWRRGDGLLNTTPGPRISSVRSY